MLRVWLTVFWTRVDLWTLAALFDAHGLMDGPAAGLGGCQRRERDPQGRTRWGAGLRRT